MNVKPILFSGPMVRALLEGRKTQTRRIIKPQPSREVTSAGVISRSGIGQTDEWSWLSGDPKDCDTWGGEGEFKTGYRPGDMLWVRENWQTGSTSDGPQISYRATPDFFQIDAWDGTDEGAGPSFNYARCPSAKFSHWLSDVLENDGPWRPSIHMPRWASRLTLEVTDVKVERLHDISEEDAAAEGVESDSDGWFDYLMPSTQCCRSARDSMRTLWDSLNAARGFGWDANPWVVAVSFRVHPMNIDEFIALINATAGAA